MYTILMHYDFKLLMSGISADSGSDENKANKNLFHVIKDDFSMPATYGKA